MSEKNSNTKSYSLLVIVSAFIVLMSTVVVITLINNKGDNITDIKEAKIETLNPLLVEKSEKVVDKTDVNIELCYEIERVYDIDVLYGEGTEYLSRSVEAQTIYNSEDINNILLQLIDCLEKFPPNIFKEIELKDYTIDICLVEYFSNDNIALATRDSNNNFKIYLSNSKSNEKVSRAIYHEAYHILEYYMKLEFDINELYRNWNIHNPEDFAYQPNISMLDENYVYNLDKYGRGHFVSVYSKVSDVEDRAEVFADTMVSKDTPSYYADRIGAIKNKMLMISEAIETCFYTVKYNNLIYWTRYF